MEEGAASSGPSGENQRHNFGEIMDECREETISVESSSKDVYTAVEDPPPCTKPADDCSKLVEKNRKKLKRRMVKKEASESEDSSSTRSSRRRVVCKRRNSKVAIGLSRRSGGTLDAIALSLGMSFAAIVAKVLEMQDSASERMSADHLSEICTSAVRESLVNVFRDKFGCFLGNFEKSFGSTLRTLLSISETSQASFLDPALNREKGCPSNASVEDCRSEASPRAIDNHSQSNTIEEVLESSLELALSRQVGALAPSMYGLETDGNVLTTFERSIVEQTRSNDLKVLELGLTMKKLKFKETELALNHDSNLLERAKIAMGISKFSFKTEKFKTQLEDVRYSELLRKCTDCLVAGLIITLISLFYGAYVYSYTNILEATAACTPSTKESKFWGMLNPMSFVTSGLRFIWCHVQVLGRALISLLMIFTFTCLVAPRLQTSKPFMAVTLILMLLGVGCGIAGKLCIDMLGGSGWHWVIYWSMFCSLHLFSSLWASLLFPILHGPISVSQGENCNPLLPYWFRRSLFYAVLLVFLPLSCGLLPFASLFDWKDHFYQIAADYLGARESIADLVA